MLLIAVISNTISLCFLFVGIVLASNNNETNFNIKEKLFALNLMTGLLLSTGLILFLTY